MIQLKKKEQLIRKPKGTEERKTNETTDGEYEEKEGRYMRRLMEDK